MVIVGIGCSHDASACIMIDGQVKHAIQLERVTRRKRDGVPILASREAVDYCLDAVGLSPLDVDYFAFNIQNLTPEYVGLLRPLLTKEFDLFDPFSNKALYFSHHLCHAFSAFAGSGFDECKVVVADGSSGVTVGSDDLCLTGEQLKAYLLDGLQGSTPSQCA